MFDEDTQFVLGPGIADEMAAGITEGRICLADLFLQGMQLAQGHAGTDLQVHQGLGIFAHTRGEVGQGGALLPHEPQDLQGAEDAIARRSVISEDEVAGVLSPERITALAEGFDDVAVADGRGDHADAGLAHGFVQAEVRHHGADHRVAAEFALFLQGKRAERQDAVTGHAGPAGVAEDHPVGVTVERDADIGSLLFDDLAGKFGIKGADSGVDVDAVRFDAELNDFGAEFLEDERASR